MLKLASLFAVLAMSAAAYVPPSPNDLDNALDSFSHDMADTRMAGGDMVTDVNAFSFMVGIQPKYDVTRNGVAVETLAPFCSGILIRGQTNATQYYVLTSAHCAQSGTRYDFYAGNVKVTATTPALETNVQATTAVINEEFRQTSMTGDLAIIPTATIVPTASATQSITAATLAGINDATKSYLINTVTMAGWGYPNDVYDGKSPSLRSLSSWVVPNWYCAVRHINMPIKRTHVCTAGLPNKGPCTSDSGAPLVGQATGTSGGGATVTSRVVIGLATQTPRSGCSRGKPGVFTRIGDYLPWIIQVTNYDPDATQ